MSQPPRQLFWTISEARTREEEEFEEFLSYETPSEEGEDRYPAWEEQEGSTMTCVSDYIHNLGLALARASSTQAREDIVKTRMTNNPSHFFARPGTREGTELTDLLNSYQMDPVAANFGVCVVPRFMCQEQLDFEDGSQIAGTFCLRMLDGLSSWEVSPCDLYICANCFRVRLNMPGSKFVPRITFSSSDNMRRAVEHSLFCEGCVSSASGAISTTESLSFISGIKFTHVSGFRPQKIFGDLQADRIYSDLSHSQICALFGASQGHAWGKSEWIQGQAPGMQSYSSSPLSFCSSPFMRAPNENASKSTLYLGVELEVQWKESQTTAMEYVYETMPGLVVVCPDGSLSAGFEIKSIPATLAAHKLLWDKFLSKAHEHLRSYTASCSCGMHVHMSRDAFTPMLLSRMLMFYNDKKNHAFLSRIAGRDITRTSYCTPKGHKPSAVLANQEVRTVFAKYKKHPRLRPTSERTQLYDKYQPLRTATGKPTYEVRIFRGNVSKGGFYRNLDFVAAVYEFCATTPVPLATNFIAWFAHPDRLARYPHLAAFAKGRFVDKVPGHRVFVDEADLVGQSVPLTLAQAMSE